ncbi:uncharacterized protein LOC143543242 [Bidens hawaiensis]|uniref:uncharacterized protein LOC143543242 n=1 Tax=Bidens hawaiensis TaxID=980011 RepID=UPI00404B34B8
MSFRTQHLLPVRAKVNRNVRDFDRRRRDFVAQRRLPAEQFMTFGSFTGIPRVSAFIFVYILFTLRAIGISRELNAVNRRTRPLPKQRSFGQPGMLPPGVSKERILQWRASIYEQNMVAVPCPTRKSLEQVCIGRNSNKEILLKRIEPWIHRELHAVLGDPNPVILVHLVTSLFISSLERTHENNHLERLQPFLLGRTSTFWHELRCFAESSLNLEAYDTIVKYEKVSN